MTLDEVTLLLKLRVRNFFNEDNDAGKPPEQSAMYSLFLSICREFHEKMEQGIGQPTNIVQESVLGGKHSYTLATSDGLPMDLLDAYTPRLAPFTRMFYKGTPL